MEYKALIKRLQLLIYLIRRGQINQALAFFVLAFFAAGEYFRREWKEVQSVLHVASAAYALGVVCFVWLLWRVWKRAVPPPETEAKAAPSAIKGLLPWGVADGDLFARLGRRAELALLLDRVQNDQIPITVVRGESGAGKTSLLQAGLQYTLKKENCVYWEARPNNAPTELLHAIRNQFPDIESLNSLPDASNTRWVLILDQFEQLRSTKDEHLPIFELLARIVREPAPHRLSTVVSFRREYQADWADFEIAEHFRAEQVKLDLMPRPVAGDVIATLASEAGFSVDQKLIDNFLANIAQDSSRSERVSPLDVSIGLESLANFVQQRAANHITMNDYQLAGGAEGLLLLFIQQRLEEVPEAVRVPLLNGIVLSLVDLVTNQRVAEGGTAVTIASKAGLPVETIKPWLDRLTYPRVRLLEAVVPGCYRLPHERLVQILRRLTGSALASLDQTKLLLEGAYAQWRQTHNRRNLLNGKDLALVLRHRELLLPAGDAAGKTEYLQACLGRRRMLRLTGAGIGIAIAGSAYTAYCAVDTLQQRRALRSWGLSPELFRLQHDLDGLEIGNVGLGSGHINDFAWLRSTRLRELEVTFDGSSLAGLERLKSLVTLNLHLGESKITSLATLGQLKRLTTLSLDFFHPFSTLFPADPAIISLSLAGLEQLKRLTTLSLDLSDSKITSLAALGQLKGLTTLSLDLRSSGITSVAELEQLKGLATLSLDLSYSKFSSLAGLEQLKGLTTLSLDLGGSKITSLAALQQLDGLTTLSLHFGDSAITSLAGLEQLKGLNKLSLHLSGSKITSLAGLEQLKGLTTLSLKSYDSAMTSLKPLEQLEGLKTLSLDLSDSKISSLTGLEQLKGLSTLSLDLRDSKVSSLAGLEQLKGLNTLSLDLGDSKISSLAGLEQLKGLNTLSLDLGDSQIDSLAGLEQLKSLNELSLYLGDSIIDSLAGLEQLKSLTTLSLGLGASEIDSLAGLEQLKGLTSLSLDFRSFPGAFLSTSVTSLAGLEQLKGLTTLSLDLGDSQINSLAELKELKGLTSASIWLPLSLVTNLKITAKQVFVGSRA